MKLLKFAVPLLMAAGTAHADPLSLPQAINQALASSPQIQAEEAEVTAARSAARAAGALPDPRLSLALENFPISGPNAGSFVGDDMTMLTVGVMQDVPNPARRRAQRARGRADVSVASAQAAVQRREVAFQTALAWIDLYYAVRRLSALDRLDHENGLAATLIQPRIAIGDAPPADGVGPARLAALLDNRRAEVRAQAAVARAALARWIGPGAAGATPTAPPAFATGPAVLTAAVDDHPLIASYFAASERADSDLAEARSRTRPDFTLEAAYHHRDDRYGDMVSGRVIFDLPLFQSDRQQPLIAAGAARLSRVTVQREAARRQLAAELDGAVAEHSSASERLNRTRNTLLPLARQRIDLANASFQGRTGGFEPVLEARRDLAETEIAVVDLEAQVARSAARLAIYFGGEMQ